MGSLFSDSVLTNLRGQPPYKGRSQRVLYSEVTPCFQILLLPSSSREHEAGEGDADFVFEEFVRLRVAGIMEESNETDA